MLWAFAPVSSGSIKKAKAMQLFPENTYKGGFVS
jgi:hypothetical protein